jgi:hypothetical protein
MTTLDTVLLLALPASGKSEVRRYLSHLSPAQCSSDFHMGPTLQLDDFPYVHMMRRVDGELGTQGKAGIFYKSLESTFLEPRDWGTLIELLNEDHADLVADRVHEPASAALHLFERIDRASQKVGLPARIATLDEATRHAIADKMEEEASELLREQQSCRGQSHEGKTLVFEFARGGPDGAEPPLGAPMGYQHSLSLLSDEILENAGILYVWVTPEESRRKNDARTDPDDPGSILHHGVPISVMLGDYGCDDMDWLESTGAKPGTVTIETRGKTFHLPIGRFDNRVDKTSFLREDPDKWSKADVDAVHEGLRSALDKLHAAHSA